MSLVAKLRRFFAELKRRNVYRVAVTYAVVGFVLIQLADLTLVRLGLPAWTVTFVIVLVALGFPLALVLAWAFETTPEGVRRTPMVDGGDAGSAGEAGAGVGSVVPLAVLALLAAAAGGWYLLAGRGPEPPRAGERSIAVLPFEALGGEDPGPFTEGMHDDLLTRLSNVSGLRVISRTSVARYRDSDKSLPVIARELGVRWVLEGGVQRSGDQIQVNAQLIDPRTDTHAWAQDYRRNLTTENLFAIQSDLTKRIARSLEARLTAAEEERVERRPTGDLASYRLYVQGRTHLDQRTEAGMRRSLDYFRRAIREDSAYALAWTGLADAQALLANYRFGAADTLLPAALEATRRALELDPGLAEAHASLGLLQQDLHRDGPAAVRALRRSIELKPSYARSHHWLGLVLATLGRPEEGLERLRRAAELDPMSPSIHVALSGTHRVLGQPEAALEAARRAEALAPGYHSGTLYRGMALLQSGRADEASDVFATIIGDPGAPPDNRTGARGLLAVAHLRRGDTARARTLLGELEATPGARVVEGIVHGVLGDRDAAFAALRQGDYDYVATGLVRNDPLLDPLRDDSRYGELMRRVNRSWGLEPDGSFPAGEADAGG